MLSSLPAKKTNLCKKKWVQNLCDRSLIDDQACAVKQGFKIRDSSKRNPDFRYSVAST